MDMHEDKNDKYEVQWICWGSPLGRTKQFHLLLAAQRKHLTATQAIFEQVMLARHLGNLSFWM
jgi:hypothetical protein